MTRRPRTPTTLITLLVAAGFLPGCTSPVIIASAGLTAVQTGSSAFIRGELESATVASIRTIYDASLAALADLQLPVEWQVINERNAYIHARESSGRKIKIFLEARSPVVTKINIRVGVWGDQAISRLVLAEIHARSPALPIGPPSPDYP